MGKPTGFMDFNRVNCNASSPKERIKNYNEFHDFLPDDERKKQASRCMDCGVPFCQAGVAIKGMVSGCPLNNLIPEWNHMLYVGNSEMAYRRLKKTNCFPEFTGRVCPALCEASCTCNLNGEAVTSKANELSIIETAFNNGYVKPEPPKVRTDKKVAVIGSGPSGLAVAEMLNKRGHNVTVYERSDRLGGLLMYGIPNMKLEKQIIQRRISIMRKEGIEFVTNANIGENYDAKEIIAKYDAVVLACGASNPRDIDVTGRDAKGIYFAVDFLSATTKSLLDSNLADGKYISAKGKKVVVIGGGDTGNDCVGTSIRHGCASVIQLEMMPKPLVERTDDNQWPQWPRVLKTDYGQEEAIEVFGSDPRMYQTTVKEFIKDKQGNLKKLICVKLEAKKDKKTGRMNMVPIKNSEFEIEADIVLISAGFVGAESYVANAFGVKLNERTNVETAPNSYATNVPKVFVTGDMHRGQSLVVWAIREGRETAKEVDISLMGYSNM